MLNRYIGYLILSVAMLFIANYGIQAQHKTGKRQTAAFKLSLSQQAEQKMREFWKGKIVQCGESHYTKWRNNGNIGEFKGISISLEPQSISEADKLNGYEFSSLIRIKARVIREFSFNNHNWGSWSSDVFPGGDNYNKIVKYKGQWSVVEKSGMNISTNMSLVSCEDANNPQKIIRATIDAQTKAMLDDAPNLGIYMSQTPQFPMDYFKALYSSSKRGSLYKFKMFSGGYYVFFDKNSEVFPGNSSLFKLPSLMSQMFLKRNQEMAEIAVGPKNSWIEILSRYGVVESYDFEGENIPDTLRSELNKLADRQGRIAKKNVPLFIDLGPAENWVMFYGKKGYACGCTSEIQDALKEANEQALLKQFVFTSDGEWLLLYGDTNFKNSKNFSKDLIAKLKELQEKNITFDQVVFAPNGAWIIAGKFARPYWLR